MARSFVGSISGDASARRIFDLMGDLGEADYRKLIGYAVGHCNTGVLIVPATRGRGMEDVLTRLRPYAAQDTAVTSGVFRFAFNSDTAKVLADSASGLYNWTGPDRPENLCLMRADGSPWLVSHATQRLAYLELGKFEKVLLGRSLPGVAALLADAAGKEAVLGYMERRLEDHAGQLTNELSQYAQRILEESRESVVSAVRSWLLASDHIRVAAALEVVRRLQLSELRADVEKMKLKAFSNTEEVPTFYRHNPVLLQRWRANWLRQLERVSSELDGAPSMESLADEDESRPKQDDE